MKNIYIFLILQWTLIAKKLHLSTYFSDIYIALKKGQKQPFVKKNLG